jgi:predicted  nucleic acid-binding Zn-ribbon protein
MENQNQNQKKSRLQTILIIILAILVLLLVIDKFVQKSKSDEIIAQLEDSNTEKQNINEELKGLYQQYESLKTNNDSINQMLEVEKKKITELMDELKYVKTSNLQKIQEYKKEVNTLREIMRSYIVQIDSLHTRNQLLMAENVEVKSKYKDMIIRNEDLSYERDSLAGTVGKASTLKTLNLLATGINVRGKETQWIDKLDKIKVCFTIDENMVASKGMKWVYLRIAKPDKYVLNESEYDLFEYEGKQIAYTAKREIEYLGEKTDMCLYWKKSQDLQPGLYYVDIFTDGKRIGTIAFNLK